MAILRPSLVRFGAFEADLSSGELRKFGARLKLQDRPFQILAILLEQPGQTVTREQLQSRLWPADTFVDFEHGLNTAVNKLRQALSDDPDNPRFIGDTAQTRLPVHRSRFEAERRRLYCRGKRRRSRGLLRCCCDFGAGGITRPSSPLAALLPNRRNRGARSGCRRNVVWAEAQVRACMVGNAHRSTERFALRNGRSFFSGWRAGCVRMERRGERQSRAHLRFANRRGISPALDEFSVAGARSRLVAGWQVHRFYAFRY